MWSTGSTTTRDGGGVEVRRVVASQAQNHEDAEALLARHGYAGATVYRCDSAGDAGEQRETILFTQRNRPLTAYFDFDQESEAEYLKVTEGWD